jgi:superfamily II DNA helicase RecQ
MSFKFLIVPIRDDGTVGAELNAFLGGHRILSVDRRWVDQGAESYWAFCIDYLDHKVAGETRSSKGRPKDYKELLSPEDFAVFVRLRDLRKEIAQAEAVPVYTIFTNEQLAQMVENRARTKADLEKIAGVGDARMEKYGARFLELLQTRQRGTGDDEASGAAD